MLPTSTVSSIRPSQVVVRSTPRSRTGAEWVSAPTARKSTPVSATERATSSDSPPEASVSTPAARHSATLARRSSVVMLSSSTRSAPASSTSRTCSTVSHSTSTGTPGEALAHGREGRGDPAGGDDVVVLDERGVGQRHAVVDAAAAPHGVLLERAQPGRRLAGVADARAGAVDRVDPGGGERRDAGQVAQQVERGALGGEQRPHGTVGLEHRLPAHGPLAVGGQRAQLHPGHDDVEDRHRDADTGERPVGPRDEGRHPAQVGRHGRDAT